MNPKNHSFCVPCPLDFDSDSRPPIPEFSAVLPVFPSNLKVNVF